MKKQPAKKPAKPATKKPAKKSAKKPAAEKPAAKKPAAKKPAAKKPAAKKPAVKKPAAKKPAKKPAPRKPAPKKPAAKQPAAKPEVLSVPYVGREELIATLARIAPRLAADPIYANESNAPFDAAELERYFETIDGRTTVAHLFSETLQGMIQSVRYSGLLVVREIFRDDKQALLTTKPSLVLRLGQSLVVVGDLVVEGDVENDGILVVTGDLTIRGAYLGPTFDYSLVAVGGTMSAGDVSSSGEILVGDRLEARRVIHLLYNDYSSILPIVKAEALVIEDNFPALGTVEVELRIDDTPTAEQLRTIFGANAAVEREDDDDSPIRRLIRS